MSFLWLCACVYLLVGVVGLLEAEIRVKPGTSPPAARVVWSALRFGLTYPAGAAMRWALARARG